MPRIAFIPCAGDPAELIECSKDAARVAVAVIRRLEQENGLHCVVAIGWGGMPPAIKITRLWAGVQHGRPVLNLDRTATTFQDLQDPVANCPATQGERP
jgi:hypothetical protein